MKRVKSACLYQTLVFILDPKFSKEEALSKVQTEVEVYKKKANSDIQILNETDYSRFFEPVFCLK